MPPLKLSARTNCPVWFITIERDAGVALKPSILKLSLCASVIGLLSVSVHSLELQSVAYAETRYSDNAGNLKQMRRHDVRNTVGLEAQLTEQRQSMVADANVTIENERYLRNTAGERTAVTSGLGMLNLNLVEDFLNWDSSFTRSQVVEDSTQEDESANRDYRNLLRSGPQMHLELSDTTDFDAHAFYVNVENTAEDLSDSERANAGMALINHYNQLTQFSLASEYETILTEDELDQYDRQNVSVGATRTLARGSVAVGVGRSRLTPEFGESIDSNFYQVNFRQDEFLFHVLQLGYTQDVSDTSIGFDDALLIEQDTGELPTNDYVTRKRMSASLSRTIGVHSYSLQMDRSDSRYELSRQHILFHSGAFRYERPVVEHLVLGTTVSYLERDYVTDPVAGISKTLSYTVDSNYQFSDRLDVGSYIRFISRTNSSVEATEYEEFQLGVDLRYRLFE